MYLYITKDLPNFKLVKNPQVDVLLENIFIINKKLKDKQTLLNEELKEKSIQYYQKITGKKWRRNEVKSVGAIMVEVEEEMQKKYPFVAKQVHRTGNTRLMYKYKPLSYLRHALALMNMLDYNNVHFYDGLKITKDEWSTLYLGVSEGANKGFGEEDVDMLMMYSIVIFAFHKAYRRLETFYWDFRLSQDVNEIKSAMETIEGERKSLSYEKQQIAKKEAVLQNEILQEKENHFNEMTFLKKQMTQLMLENKKLKEQVKLLPSIQSALFSSNEETHVSYDTEEDVLVSLKNELNHLKVVLVGGTNSFRQKFADVLPNIYTISPDEKHIGLRQVAYADVLLFDTTYNNHSQFERCKSVLNTQKIIFLNQGSSLKINATTILKELKK